MGKLIALAALLAALLAVSTVSARTTITTTVVEDDGANPSRQEGSCQEQVSRQDNFNMCQRFLMERTKQKGSFYGDEVAMVTERENPQEKGEHLKECCRQMKNVREECRCEGLSMMMKHQQQKEQQSQQEQEMMGEAEKLPSMCDIGPRQCQIQTRAF